MMQEGGLVPGPKRNPLQHSPREMGVACGVVLVAVVVQTGVVGATGLPGIVASAQVISLILEVEHRDASQLLPHPLPLGLRQLLPEGGGGAAQLEADAVGQHKAVGVVIAASGATGLAPIVMLAGAALIPEAKHRCAIHDWPVRKRAHLFVCKQLTTRK